MWLKIAAASAQKEGDGFYDSKLALARFFATRELPMTSALRKKIEAGAETLMKVPVDTF
jgi:hypothetical protein